ncbi:MAG: energy-coupling factor transporter transmembrane component T [Ktedonobacteraceae bacterium]
MLKNISNKSFQTVSSLGIYYPGNSILHRMQARTKLLVMLCILVAYYIADGRVWHFMPYIVMGLVTFGAIWLSGVSFRHMWQRMWLLILLAVIGALPTAFIPDNPADHPVLTMGPLPVAYGLLRNVLLIYGVVFFVYFVVFLLPVERIRRTRQKRQFKVLRFFLVLFAIVDLALLFLIRLMPDSGTFPLGPIIATQQSIWYLMDFFVIFLVLYALALLLTMTTTPVALVEGLTMLLSPLRRLKLPVDDFALMTLIALRFIPTLIEEGEQLIKAQTARGASISRGSLHDRFASITAMFTPFLQGALRRAADLATALDARGYEVKKGRTPLHETSLHLLDYTVLGTVVVLLVISLVV